MRLLIVEDDRMIGESLQRTLRLEGYAVDWVRDAAAADGTLASERFDLVLLDLGLPRGGGGAGPADGLAVLQALRARRDATPVIVLTARDARGDRVAGLDAGADDYLVKPFEFDELNARIRAVLRRHAGRAEPQLSQGGVTLDPAQRRVTLNGAPVMLSAREFAVLEALMARPGAVLSRSQLEDRLYGWGEEIESNAVSVYIHQLRKKLGADFIRNVRGVGYFIDADRAGRRPMSSIRLRLLVSLVALLVLVAAAMAAITYRNVLGETEAIFDYQLQQMALSLRDQGEVASAQAGPLADEQLDFVIQIWTIDGRTIYASRPHASLPARALLGLHTLNVEGRAWRTYSVATRERVIQVAQPVEIRQRLAAHAAWRSVLPLLLMTPFAALAIWWLAAHNLAPLDALARAVRSRDARSLAPVPTSGLPDEVAPLASALNALLERLRSSLDSQRAFVADAAHELRSPLTALKLQLRLLRQAGDDEARSAAIENVGAGIDRAARLIEQLLTLARSEPGAAPAPPEPVELGELAREVLAAMHAFAHDRGSELVLDAGPPIVVAGERSALAAAIRNLVDNAIRYSPPGSRIDVGVGQEGGAAWLRVDDAGPGIPRAERERVFDRFYRRAGAGEEGSGLGLAIVRSVAERHGATLALDDSPAGGLRATLRFPPAPAPAS